MSETPLPALHDGHPSGPMIQPYEVAWRAWLLASDHKGSQTTDHSPQPSAQTRPDQTTRAVLNTRISGCFQLRLVYQRLSALAVPKIHSSTLVNGLPLTTRTGDTAGSLAGSGVEGNSWTPSCSGFQPQARALSHAVHKKGHLPSCSLAMFDLGILIFRL